MRHLIRAAALATAIVPASAYAQTTADDVRCLIVSSTFAHTATNPEAAKAAQAASGFFLGRLDGRVSAPTLRTMLAAQQKTLTPANAGPTMNACVQRMAMANRAILALAPPAASTPVKPQAGR